MVFPTPPTPPGIEICQHINLYAPFSCTAKQPRSRATNTSITVPVAITITTITTSSSNNSTSNTDTNMIYVLDISLEGFEED